MASCPAHSISQIPDGIDHTLSLAVTANCDKKTLFSKPIALIAKGRIPIREKSDYT